MRRKREQVLHSLKEGYDDDDDDDDDDYGDESIMTMNPKRENKCCTA